MELFDVILAQKIVEKHGGGGTIQEYTTYAETISELTIPAPPSGILNNIGVLSFSLGITKYVIPVSRYDTGVGICHLNGGRIDGGVGIVFDLSYTEGETGVTVTDARKISGTTLTNITSTFGSAINAAITWYGIE